ncbi:hypothetical protein BOTBODRAFT_192711 [Botryobasidium botryosum FD-172 SS1]|uniref:F-box domain-containing protein n=1 Tax=Botryobasidium botryosum (strain FD-172 SS1) TaxID=930990 RepID=A0A067LV07_BOTB1|nr:hypothetical protein BOTBODRAFT_192711 [Botryobasidium botryosum FD-172 SS1]
MSGYQTRLPPDVLLEIFDISRVSHGTDLSRLAWVCAAWRRAIHEHPIFWSTIPLDVGKRSQAEKATFWLDRAGDRLLSIQIGDSSGEEDSSPYEPSLARLGIALRGSMDRWTSFTIEASSSTVGVILKSCPGFTPKLTNVNITTLVDDDTPMAPLNVPFFLHLDRGVSKIALLTSGCVPKLGRSFGLGVTSLYLNCWRGTNLQVMFDMLKACPNLMRCTLDHIEYDQEPSYWASVELRHLLELKLEILSFLTISRLLNALEVPSLQRLSITRFYWNEVVSRLLRFYIQGCKTLTRISLIPEDWSEEGAEFGAEGTPITLDSVTHLTVYGPRTAASLLRALSCPHLEVFETQFVPFDLVHNYASLATELREISLTDIADIPNIHVPTLLLPHVTTLYIQKSVEILDFLITPSLESLTLRSVVDKQQLGMPLRQFIERQQPALRALSLHHWGVSDDEMGWYLERTPSLKKLELESSLISDATLRGLTVSTSTTEQGASAHTDISCFLPGLETIILQNNPHITPLGIINFLEFQNRISSSTHSTGAISGSPPHTKAKITLKLITLGKMTRVEYNAIQSCGGVFLRVPWNLIDGSE